MDKEEYLKRKQAHKEYVSNRNTPEEILDLYVTQCIDTIEDEKEFDRLALQIFDAEYVDGDSYSVPCTLDMFEKAVDLVEEQQAKIERLENALYNIADGTNMMSPSKTILSAIEVHDIALEALNQQEKERWKIKILT